MELLHRPATLARATLLAPDRGRVALRRLLLAMPVAMLAAAAVAVATGRWPLAVSAGWTAGAVVYLASVWLMLLDLGAPETRRVARREDSSRAEADSILVCASVASLISVAFLLVEGAHQHGLSKAGFTALAVVSVVSAWFSVHTVYALRYASHYYSDPIGGIDYHSDDPPDYRDFAYLALTIGMTFQVSDTDLTAKDIRRTAVQHALLSYLFGAVIIALMINIVAGLSH